MFADIELAMKQNGGALRTADLVGMGFSKPAIAELVRNRRLDRVAHGIYVRAGEFADEMHLLQMRSPRVVFSHESALWLNGLSDREPFQMSVTVVRGVPLAVSLRGLCSCHYVDRDLLEIGLSSAKTTQGHVVRCYGPERTICDIVRDSSRIGIEEMTDGLKRYAGGKEKDLVELMRIAAMFGIEDEMAKYMGVLS